MRTLKFNAARLLGAALTALATVGCLTAAASAQTVYNNGTGTNNGYYYSLYTSSGSATMTFPSASQYPGNYAISWSGVGDGRRQRLEHRQ
jgi:endo-1,4-beta-xylanase